MKVVVQVVQVVQKAAVQKAVQKAVQAAWRRCRKWNSLQPRQAMGSSNR